MIFINLPKKIQTDTINATNKNNVTVYLKDTWSNAVNETTADDTGSGTTVAATEYWSGEEYDFLLIRQLYKFDTSSVTSETQSAKLHFYVSTDYDNNIGATFYAQKHENYDGSVTNSDFDIAYFTTDYGSGVAYDDGTLGYRKVEISLNSDFLNDANNNDTLSIGIRHQKDYNEVAPTNQEYGIYPSNSKSVYIEFTY